MSICATLPLEPFAGGSLWLKRVPLRFFGLQMETRMTVVRRRDGWLLVKREARCIKKERPKSDGWIVDNCSPTNV